MTNVQIAIKSETAYSTQTMVEIFNAVETSDLSPTASQLVKEVLGNPDAVVDDGELHDSWNHREPCPECGSNELVIWSVTDDTFVIEDGVEHPIDDGCVWGNPQTICNECCEVLYRRAGF